jgi:uncharacterized damage-inducible protein DinB
MSISQSLLPEFDREMVSTRRVLERITPDKFEWRPHEKSNSLGRLASHVADLPGWAKLALTTDSLDLGPEGVQPQIMQTTEQLLELFDKNVAEGHAAIAAASDQDLFKPWALSNQGHKMFTMPKVAVLRNFTLNHIIHHRGQLTVYLRLTGIPVPSIYGPSADEPNP